MDNFVVSARKYRPTTFDSVVGQKSITNTLKNAIKTNHLAQAFLFCGSRGVGKTSCARILAKTINCFNRTENIEACDECDSCQSFNEGASLNIHELDAASNNSVDDIRNLIDQVRFAPQIGTHKVYIIDEVHMLSPAAFNAFLKTLEEPPAHAIFILATTEKHKIIPTILSRCQIFDFSRISVDDIAHHLLSIAKKENINAEEEAVHLIAQKADGALRDALSIFDQLVSFTGAELSYQAVIDNLNILDYDYYFKATNYLLEGNIPNILLLFNEVIQNGFEGRIFLQGLAGHFRNLLVCKDEQTVALLEVGKSIKKQYLQQSKECSLSFLMKALEICRSCDTQYQSSRNKRLLIELSLMQMASILHETTSEEKKKPIIQAVDSIEKSTDTKVKEPKKTETKETTTTSPPNKNVETEETSIIPEKAIQSDEEKSKLKEEPIATKNQSQSSESEKENPEVPKTSLSKLAANKAKTSSLSINQLTKQDLNENKEKAEAYTSDAREAFTQEEFNTCWNELANKIKAENGEGNSIVFAAMNRYEPVLTENHQINVQVDNKSQLEEMKLKRTDLHDFLRKRLKNGAIEINLSIQKNKDLKKAYTDEEKFNQLAEKNPNLKKLKQELGFDFL